MIREDRLGAEALLDRQPGAEYELLKLLAGGARQLPSPHILHYRDKRDTLGSDVHSMEYGIKGWGVCF